MALDEFLVFLFYLQSSMNHYQKSFQYQSWTTPSAIEYCAPPSISFDKLSLEIERTHYRLFCYIAHDLNLEWLCSIPEILLSKVRFFAIPWDAMTFVSRYQNLCQELLFEG